MQTVKHLRGDHSKNHGLGMNGEKPSWSQCSSRHIFFHDHTIANHTIDSSIHPQVAKSEWAVGCIWPALNEKSSLQKSTRVPKMIIRLYIQIYIYICVCLLIFSNCVLNPKNQCGNKKFQSAARYVVICPSKIDPAYDRVILTVTSLHVEIAVGQSLLQVLLELVCNGLALGPDQTSSLHLGGAGT